MRAGYREPVAKIVSVDVTIDRRLNKHVWVTIARDAHNGAEVSWIFRDIRTPAGKLLLERGRLMQDIMARRITEERK